MNIFCAIFLWVAAIQTPLDRQLGQVDFEQKLGAQLPLDLSCRDDNGLPVRLGSFFGTRPVVLVFACSACPNLCQVVLNGALDSLRTLPGTVGGDYDIVAVSIDPA